MKPENIMGGVCAGIGAWGTVTQGGGIDAGVWAMGYLLLAILALVYANRAR